MAPSDPEDGDLVQEPRKIAVPDDVQEAVRTLIRWAGDDPDREGLLDTPARVARAWKEYARGYDEDPAHHLSRTFEEVGGYDEIVLLKDIPFQSHCEHHLAPIIGKAAIAYLPSDRVVGISKLARVLHGFARRLQVQERLTAQVADCIWEHLQPQGVAVVIEASHACMTARGVAHARRDDDHQPDDGRVPRGRAQPPRSAGADGLLMRRAAPRPAAARRLRRRTRSARGNATANQIERLSTPDEEPAADPQRLGAAAAARRRATSPTRGWAARAARFSAAARCCSPRRPSDAIARIGGSLLHFAHSAPVGPSGGFFEDRQISISVGRTDAATAGRRVGGWPARITVTNRRTGAQVELAGIWRCGA